MPDALRNKFGLYLQRRDFYKESGEGTLKSGTRVHRRDTAGRGDVINYHCVPNSVEEHRDLSFEPMFWVHKTVGHA